MKSKSRYKIAELAHKLSIKSISAFEFNIAKDYIEILSAGRKLNFKKGSLILTNPDTTVDRSKLQRLFKSPSQTELISFLEAQGYTLTFATLIDKNNKPYQYIPYYNFKEETFFITDVEEPIDRIDEAINIAILRILENISNG